MTTSERFDVDPAIAPILATALDAVAVMTPEGVIAGWNEVAERTFGWSWAETQGQQLGEMMVPVQHREAHRKGLERLAAGGKPHVINRRIEITALRKDGLEIPIELSITVAPSSTGLVFIGFLRDISERRQAEVQIERQELESRLIFELTSMAAESDSFEHALQKALEAICAITGWPVGHAFVVPPGNQNVLRSSGVWVEAEAGMAKLLRDATEMLTFRQGVGLPGTILASGEPHWITDTDSDENFPRKHCGFRGAFGFPLMQSGRVSAILEFFSTSPAPPEPALILTVRALGEQVGRVFERKRTQDHQGLLLHEMNHRVKNTLAVVQAIAQQTFRRATTLEDGLEVFRGRLMAVAHAQDVLVSQNVVGATLGEIITGALKGSGVSPDRVKTKGPKITVASRHAVMISLAVHELCTNAFKYGSLLNDDGLVLVKWGLDATKASFYFEWREVGGPKVIPPQSKGFGSSLLERGLASELGGQITVDYDPAGVVCRFTGSLPEGMTP